jgi:hypothetical protein
VRQLDARLSVFVLAAAIILTIPALASERRSHAITAEFQREHPCPSTGKTVGTCPGFVKDHTIPLCAGGADSATNMQWQTIEDAKAKDRWEREWCRQLTG